MLSKTIPQATDMITLPFAKPGKITTGIRHKGGSMVKEIELNAPLDILNKVEATGLPCHWNGVSLVITLDDDSSEDLFKLGKALSGAKKVTYHISAYFRKPRKA
jgi:hypothetical protein